MALSVSAPYPAADVWGTRRVAIVTVTFDSSYATGGEAFDPASYGIAGKPAAVIVAPRPLTSSGYVVQYDRVNAKLMVLWVDTTVDGAALAEVANTTNLSTLVVDVIIVEGSGQ
jgi:hypothetical protein